MYSIVDSHCHLNFKDFKQDFEDIFIRAAQNKVNYFLTISVNLEDFEQINKISKNKNNLWCTTGIHPNYVPKDLNKKSIKSIKRILESNILKEKVIGIGETGLDYFRGEENKDNQKTIFDLQMELSSSAKLPMVVHTRNADSDTLEFIKRAKYMNVNGIMHCFASSLELAKEALNSGFYISFSGMVTFSKNSYLNQIIKYVPNDRLLLETDSPYLSPEPNRGKRNEPSNIIYTLKYISKIKNITEKELADQTTQNFFKLFSKINDNKS
tara:strand:+ start:5042 stop:5845 length:804 start_codon:yes stop_codon:yes gene_type:complete